MATVLDLLVQDRCRRPKVEDALDLVTTSVTAWHFEVCPGCGG